MMTDRGRLPVAMALLLVAAVCAAEDEAGMTGLTDDTEVTHLTDDSSDRVPLHTRVPVYPPRARRERLEGEVEVCFHVNREGQTSRIAVRRSTNRMFEKPAILAVRASTYHPLREGRKPSGIKTCRTFRFRLTPVAIEQPR